MYAREVDGRTLTLVVSGMLWQRSLVMMDQETGSLWSHLLGRCMRGRLLGKELKALPAVMTDWATWRRRHPHTTVLNLGRTASEYQRDFYQNPDRFVLGAVIGGAAKAWPLDQLQSQPVVNDQLKGTPLLILFDRQSSTALLYDRRVRGRTLTFQVQGGELVDTQTASRWELTGKAVHGRLKDEQLNPLVGIPSYRKAWRAFHPQSAYWQAPVSK